MAEDFTADLSFTTSLVSLSHTLTHSLIHANADSQDEVDIQVLLWFQDFSLGNEGPVLLWDLRERRLQVEELLRRGKVTGSVVSPCLFQLRHPLPHSWNHPDPTGHQATSASRRQTEEVKLLFRLRQTAKRIQKLKATAAPLVLATTSGQLPNWKERNWVFFKDE